MTDRRAPGLEQRNIKPAPHSAIFRPGIRFWRVMGRAYAVGAAAL